MNENSPVGKEQGGRTAGGERKEAAGPDGSHGVCAAETVDLANSN